MRKGDNQGEDRQPVTPEEIKVNNSEKILEEIQSIRNSVENLKTKMEDDSLMGSKTGNTTAAAGAPSGKVAGTVETPATGTVAGTVAGAPSAGISAGAPSAGTVAGAPVGEAAVGKAAGTSAGAPSAGAVGTPAGPAVQDPAEARTAASEKVIKAIVDEERRLSGDKTPEVVDFAAKYKDHMMRQVTDADEKKRKHDERLNRREAARKEKEQLKALRAEKRAENKRRRKEEDEARKRERAERTKELRQKREIRAEVRRKKRIAHKTAKIGGGIVQYHGTEISTEVQPVAKYSIRELLGFAHRDKIKAAETEEEKSALLKEQEIIAEDARQAAAHLQKVRASRYQNTLPGRIAGSIKSYSETHKKLLLSIFGGVLLIIVGITGFSNYYTLYEYSYNGHALGYVRDKDDVLKITDMVQKALSTDKDIQVVIDDRDDITFKKVSALDKGKEAIVADTSDQVLKRLTYMGDLNVKAWGIYVNGRKVGAVQKKAYAADVLKELEKRYSSGRDGAVIEKAEVQEDIEVKKSNTDLRDVSSVERMTDKLCSNDEREIIHTIAAEETLKDIAKEYQISVEDILLENEGLDPKKLVAGETLLIKKTGPPVTVRITEKRTYEQKIKYETEEKKTDQMYEGETEIKQEGKNGRERITERSVSINGDINDDDITILDRKVKRKAVKKIIIVGTAERPPSVGDGVYIWPMEGGYTLTSRFGRRWGRLHAGIDLATGVGNDVLAADGGIVTRAGYFGGYGLCVDVDHQNGQSTRYGHLSQTLVSPGDEVYEGQHIAESGNSGFSTGPHLHFEIHIGGSATDPLPYLP